MDEDDERRTTNLVTLSFSGLDQDVVMDPGRTNRLCDVLAVLVGAVSPPTELYTRYMPTENDAPVLR